MKVAKFSVVLVLITAFVYSAVAQNANSASLLANVTSSERVLLPDGFDFHKSLTISYEVSSKEKGSNLKFKIRYPESQSYMAMTISGLVDDASEKRPEIVVDFKRQRIINFMCFSDTKMALIHTLTESKKDVSILKTKFENVQEKSRIKQILNYPCTENTFNTGDFKGTLWLTETIDENLKAPFEALGLKIASMNGKPDRYIIRYESKNKATKEFSKLSVDELNLSDDYTIKAKEFVASFIPVK